MLVKDPLTQLPHLQMKKWKLRRVGHAQTASAWWVRRIQRKAPCPKCPTQLSPISTSSFWSFLSSSLELHLPILSPKQSPMLGDSLSQIPCLFGPGYLPCPSIPQGLKPSLRIFWQVGSTNFASCCKEFALTVVDSQQKKMPPGCDPDLPQWASKCSKSYLYTEYLPQALITFISQLQDMFVCIYVHMHTEILLSGLCSILFGTEIKVSISVHKF